MIDNDFPYRGGSGFRDLLDRGEERGLATLPLPNGRKGIAHTLPLPNRGGVPNRPYNPAPEPAKPTQPDEGFDGFREKYGIPRASESSDFLRQYVAGSPSFNMDPDIDSPTIDRDIKQYRERYGPSKIDMEQLDQNIQRLRNMIRGATRFDAPQNSGSTLAANQGPSTPVKYDESIGGYVPNQGATRPANIRYKGFPGGA